VSEMTPERARQILAGATRHNAMLEAQGDLDGHVVLAIEQANAYLEQHARAEAAEERAKVLEEALWASQEALLFMPWGVLGEDSRAEKAYDKARSLTRAALADASADPESLAASLYGVELDG